MATYTKSTTPLLVLAAAVTMSCDRPISRGDAQSIAEDMADAHTSQLEIRIIELEEKVERLERGEKLSDDYAKAIHGALDEERENRVREISDLRDHYNDHLARSHGATTR